MMKPLHVSSSSFVIPQNKAWNMLSGIRQLSFGEYGDWSSSLREGKDQHELALVLFLDDFVGSRTSSRDEALNLFQGFFQLLQQRLGRSSLLTIVGIASLDDSNAISSSKKISIKSYLQYEIFNQLEIIGAKYSHLHMVNLDSQFAQHGLGVVIDYRNWYFAHSRISNKGLEISVNAIKEIVLRYELPPAKVLLLDCDNTLWGGVAGEDGLGGLAIGQDGMGQVFLDFQIEIKKIAEKGTILCLVSKNNEADVWEVFDQHSEMILTREDITAWKINWEEKGYNIRELAQDLNLSLDSFVFWDDNPLERDKASNLVPEMNTVDIPKNIYEWPTYLRTLNDFSKPFLTDNDLHKVKQYGMRANFVRDSNNLMNESQYLKSINLKPTTNNINDSNISRAAQMCSKTNQFNLRTIRYAEGELRSLIREKNEFCFLVYLKDSYGDHGSVGLVILREVNEEVIFVDNLLISCRVLGRHLEDWIMREIIKIAKFSGYKKILGEIKHSIKNTVCQNFFIDHNFIQISEDEHLLYGEIIGDADVLYLSALEDIKLDYIGVYDE